LNQLQDPNTPNQIKTRKSKISQAIRIVCWNTYIGEDVGKTHCMCCKTINITQHNFHCGHVVAEANGGKVQVDNLRPICAVCNNSMGTANMKEFALINFNVEI
jgi:5-methylcytosine-specific restriction endonuclease McrA